MRKVSLSILLIICSLSLLSEENVKKKVSIIKFVPGLFQIKEKKIVKGGLLLSSFIIGITGAIVNNNSGNDYYKLYVLSEDIKEITALRRKTEDKFRSRNFFLLGTSVFFLLHLFDLKFFSEKSGVKGEIKNNSINFGIYYHF